VASSSSQLVPKSNALKDLSRRIGWAGSHCLRHRLLCRHGFAPGSRARLPQLQYRPSTRPNLNRQENRVSPLMPGRQGCPWVTERVDTSLIWEGVILVTIYHALASNFPELFLQFSEDHGLRLLKPRPYRSKTAQETFSRSHEERPASSIRDKRSGPTNVTVSDDMSSATSPVCQTKNIRS
jgi:hypothetical protein